jgi:DNA-binding NtrC family response regulator
MPEARKESRVFIVDDEQVIVSTTAIILRSHGFDAKPFTDPLKALHAASVEAPDLMICAVLMPLVSGVDLAIQVRELCPDCKVILWSGRPDTPDLLEIWRTRGHSFRAIPKPIRPVDLISEIKNVIGDGSPPPVFEPPLISVLT